MQRSMSFYRLTALPDGGRALLVAQILLLSLLFAFALMPAASAQVSTAYVIGTLADQSGAAVPGANVTIINTGAQPACKVMMGPDADYYFTPLPASICAFAIDAAGFGCFKLTTSLFASGQSICVAVRMEIGSLIETEEVASAVANRITKSGINHFKGTLFEIVQNEKLDSNEYFNSMAQQPKPKHGQNQFALKLAF
jgi:hypothetical protein